MLDLCVSKLGAKDYGPEGDRQRLYTEHPAKIDLILIDVMLYPPMVKFDRGRMLDPECRAISCSRSYARSGP